MTNIEYYKNQASNAATKDFNNGLSLDYSRHYALDGSAWAVHYEECYKRHINLNKK